MRRRIRVKPSKPASIVGMIAGTVFVFLGVTVAIPTFGMFGIVWTLVAALITVIQAVNAFSEKGVPSYEIEEDIQGGMSGNTGDFESALRKLNKLKEDGLISDAEFEAKRTEIMQRQW